MFELSDKVENTPVTATVVLPPVMSKAEARQCVVEINNSVNRIRQLLVELDEREGYTALGFKNMSQLMQSGLFNKARSTLQKELQAGKIENHYLNVPFGTFPETHFRPLVKLKPEYYKSAFSNAAQIAAPKAITEKDVALAVATMLSSDKSVAKRGIVSQLKEKPLTTAKDFCKVGDAFILTKLGGAERKYNGCWVIATNVKDFTFVVDVHDGTLPVKPDNLKPIDEPDARRKLPQTLKRIKRLRNVGLLDRGAYYVLEGLGRQTYLTDFEADLLTFMEQRYGVEDLD